MGNKKKEKPQTIRIAGMGDIHMDETKRGFYRDMFTTISQEADILCLCGDLTHRGLPSEAEMLVEELQACTIPVVGVLGNHDYDKDMQKELIHILSNRMTVLSGTTVAVQGIHFAGIKGFGGGFTPTMWGRIGEYAQKTFYDEAEREAEKLENALNELSRMSSKDVVVLMHFSPIRKTVEGEIVELYPFLGSTRFEEVIDRHKVAAVLHGHSHFGSPFGKTTKDISVYNVAFPLLQKEDKKKPYRIITI